jgi:exopolysaccharide production protein ExoZ
MNKKYVMLEVMRGFAALWVLLYHAALNNAAFSNEIKSNFINRGYLGVEFFFILSGFIISYSTITTIKHGGLFKQYAFARLLRVYLPYYPIGLSLLLIYFIFPDLSLGNRDIGFVTSITLFPTEYSTALSVAWTLKHELLFYSLFGLMFFSKKIGFSCLSIWLIFIFITYFAGYSYENSFLKLLSNPINIWFFVGILLYLLPNIQLTKVYWYLTILVLFVLLFFTVETGMSSIFIGIILALFIYFFTRMDRINIFIPKPLIFLGTASYSIYLIHNPLQSILARIPDFLEYNINSTIFFLYLVIFSLMGGFFYYKIIEKRCVKFSKKITSRYQQ